MMAVETGVITRTRNERLEILVSAGNSGPMTIVKWSGRTAIDVTMSIPMNTPEDKSQPRPYERVKVADMMGILSRLQQVAPSKEAGKLWNDVAAAMIQEGWTGQNTTVMLGRLSKTTPLTFYASGCFDYDDESPHLLVRKPWSAGNGCLSESKLIAGPDEIVLYSERKQIQSMWQEAGGGYARPEWGVDYLVVDLGKCLTSRAAHNFREAYNIVRFPHVYNVAKTATKCAGGRC